jgi:hypothetical protein
MSVRAFDETSRAGHPRTRVGFADKLRRPVNTVSLGSCHLPPTSPALAAASSIIVRASEAYEPELAGAMTTAFALCTIVA